MTKNENIENSKKKFLPKLAYPIVGIIGLLLIAYVAINLFQGYSQSHQVNPALAELEKTPIGFQFNPAAGDPKQLEFKISGSADYRGLVVTNIKMSDKYPGVIESGTLKNIGGADLEIKYLGATGGYMQNALYTGYFVVHGYNVSTNQQFTPPLLLKQGEEKEIRFRFVVENGQNAYYPIDGVTEPDQVVLRGNAKEIGFVSVVSAVKAVTS